MLHRADSEDSKVMRIQNEPRSSGSGRLLLWLLPLVVSAADISSQNYLDDVKFLASPELKGRATGTPELEKAAEFIAARFRSFGLKPVDGKNFEQAFPVTLGAHDGQIGKAHV